MLIHNSRTQIQKFPTHTTWICNLKYSLIEFTKLNLSQKYIFEIFLVKLLVVQPVFLMWLSTLDDMIKGNRQKYNRRKHTRCNYISLHFMGVYLFVNLIVKNWLTKIQLQKCQKYNGYIMPVVRLLGTPWLEVLPSLLG